MNIERGLTRLYFVGAAICVLYIAFLSMQEEHISTADVLVFSGLVALSIGLGYGVLRVLCWAVRWVISGFRHGENEKPDSGAHVQRAQILSGPEPPVIVQATTFTGEKAMKKYFSMKMNRATYWKVILLMGICFACCNTVIGDRQLAQSLGPSVILGALSVMVLIEGLRLFIVTSARLRDVGWSPWWALVTLIPIVGWVVTAPLLFKATRKEQAIMVGNDGRALT